MSSEIIQYEKKGNSMTKIAVIGCGAWATAIANHVSEAHDCRIWCYSQQAVDDINIHRQRKRLPGVSLHTNLTAYADLKECINGVDAIIFCVASTYVIDTLKRWTDCFDASVPVLSLTKGIVSDKTIWLRDIFNDYLPGIRYAVLSGPNLAIEIAEGKPTASVVAAEHQADADFFQQCLSSSRFRVYTSTDLKGVVLGGVLKNIFAIAAGCVDALDCGNNTKASLITRALQEMIRFGSAFSANTETFFGLSGLGDLIATCQSDKSRNYQVGYSLGKGKSLDVVVKDLGIVAEGVNTTRKIMEFAKKMSIDMPITAVVHAVLNNNIRPEDAIEALMNRKLIQES